MVREGKRATVPLPFDPNEVWGARERHHVAGTVNGCTIRGPLREEASGHTLPLGPAWLRDNPLPEGEELDVALRPEGPQAELLAEDIAAALAAQPEAAAFFSSLATFYRKGYLTWIDSAKRPATRTARIAETVRLLASGQKQR